MSNHGQSRLLERERLTSRGRLHHLVDGSPQTQGQEETHSHDDEEYADDKTENILAVAPGSSDLAQVCVLHPDPGDAPVDVAKNGCEHSSHDSQDCTRSVWTSIFEGVRDLRVEKEGMHWEMMNAMVQKVAMECQYFWAYTTDNN
jgi:hypothetical protein